MTTKFFQRYHPEKKILSTVSSPSLASMSATMTLAPFLAKVNAIARPIPRPAPVIKSLITMASSLNREDYWKKGRTVEKLGMSGFSLKELKQFITSGKL